MRNFIFKLMLILLPIALLSGEIFQESNKQVKHTLKTNETAIKPVKYPSYGLNWKKVDSLVSKQLPKSALKLVDEIMKRAKTEQNQPMQIKALMYQLKLNQHLEEHDFLNALDRIEEFRQTNQQPLKQILNSIKAEIIWQYFQSNRYQFYGRSTTQYVDSDSINTWDLKKIINEINTLFLSSLGNPELLQQTPISDFDYITTNSNDTTIVYTPTVYDLLVQNALYYLKHEETSITKPLETYSINDERFFGNQNTFLSIPTNSIDTLSHHLMFTKIIQQAIRFHQHKNYPEAKLQYQLMRLDFAYQKSTFDNKDELYENALTELKSAYSNSTLEAEVNAQLVEYYYQKSDYLDQNNLIKAHDLAQKTIENFPNSRARLRCKKIIQEIETKSISGQLEQHYPTNRPILAQISYKNIDSIYIHVYRCKNNDDRYYYNLEEKLKGKELVYTKKVALPQFNDFKNHTTEIVVDELPLGNYLVLYSKNPTKLKSGEEYHWVTPIQITNLAYSERKISNEHTSIQVVNRMTGKSISEAKISVFKTEYSYTQRKNKYRLLGTYKTDVNGWCQIPLELDYHGHKVEISYEKDKLSSSIYLFTSKDDEKIRYTDHLFTDRAIYRPGQTVYFKGIRLSRKNKKSNLVPADDVEVLFRNVNYQEIQSIKLKTNDFASFSGSFKIPETGLTGQMTIKTNYGSIRFSVEEYKRPTFKVELLNSKQAYKLGDVVEVNGIATAYAGNVINDAKVKYTIKRTTYYPNWGRRFAYFPVENETKMVKFGELKTDENGEFQFDFTTQYDSKTMSDHVQFNYQIEVEVTGMNGETRTESKSIKVSKSALHLNVRLQETMELNASNSMQVKITNSEGEEIKTSGQIIIKKYDDSELPKVNRLWSHPDSLLISKAEFETYFPYLVYKQSTERKLSYVKSISFNTNEENKIVFKTKYLKPGLYQVETTSKDKDGVVVKDLQNVLIFDKQSKKPAESTLLTVYNGPKQAYQPGEKIHLYLASSLQNQQVLIEVLHDGNLLNHQFVTVNNEQIELTFDVEEKHRGGVYIQFSTVFQNRYLQRNNSFNVPFSNRELQVKFETFRDKLLPGTKEEWRIHLSGPKKEKVAAEMLLTMYDASLDAYKSNYFQFNPFSSYSPYNSRTAKGFNLSYGTSYTKHYRQIYIPYLDLIKLNLFGYHYGRNNYYIDGISVRGARALSVNTISNAEMEHSPLIQKDGAAALFGDAEDGYLDKKADKAQTGVDLPPLEETQVSLPHQQESQNNSPVPVALRRNFNETAFFFPHLKTDVNGDVLVSFTAPESLTTWKILGLAHTQDLNYALIEKSLITQKELMVQTNTPRFVRIGDTLILTTKISNLTSENISGQANIQLLNPFTMKEQNQDYQIQNPTTTFEVEKKQSAVVKWKLIVPEKLGSLMLRVTAQSANHSDGEELMIPVLSNRVLVTESMPLTINGNGSRTYHFEKLIQSNQSSSLKHHAVTLEFTSNPAWYVIQSLPYMLEYPHDCSEQIFTRFYANSIASNIVRSSPKIKEVFESWKSSSPDAFLSKLEKNEQLKSVLLEETPWVLAAQSETERKKRIALLFDFNKMDNQLAKNLTQLNEAQVANGGFPWFPGMRESRYITQYIVSGMGHLNELGIQVVKENNDVQKMIRKAVNYIDNRIVEDYLELKKRKGTNSTYFLYQNQIQYLYARSFFLDIKFNKQTEEAYRFYLDNARKNWTKLNLNNQTMLALITHRNQDVTLANDIMNSIVERSMMSEELGMYWKENTSGFFWYQAPIETQALIIEALHTIKNDQKSINQAKIWLLRNKQTNDWATTRATANACYSLLLGQNSFTEQDELVQIEVGGKTINPADFGAEVEAGTGYFQRTWVGEDVHANLGQVKITRKTEGFSYGAMYWQYFEMMDKVTSAETNLKLEKQMFLVKQTTSGEVIVPIQSSNQLHRGDKIRVRIILSTDRDMEFVHLKDYRASGFEPVNVLSRYKWQDGLGYYESTKDVATHFFFDVLRKGKYVFEYDLMATHSGQFSNGFALIECMYAPEFKSHSNGIRVEVVD